MITPGAFHPVYFVILMEFTSPFDHYCHGYFRGYFYCFQDSIMIGHAADMTELGIELADKGKQAGVLQCITSHGMLNSQAAREATIYIKISGRDQLIW